MPDENQPTSQSNLRKRLLGHFRDKVEVPGAVKAVEAPPRQKYTVEELEEGAYRVAAQVVPMVNQASPHGFIAALAGSQRYTSSITVEYGGASGGIAEHFRVKASVGPVDSCGHLSVIFTWQCVKANTVAEVIEAVATKLKEGFEQMLEKLCDYHELKKIYDTATTTFSAQGARTGRMPAQDRPRIVAEEEDEVEGVDAEPVRPAHAWPPQMMPPAPVPPPPVPPPLAPWPTRRRRPGQEYSLQHVRAREADQAVAPVDTPLRNARRRRLEDSQYESAALAAPIPPEEQAPPGHE